MRIRKKISTKIILSIITINLVILIALGTIISLLIYTNVGNMSSNYAMSQVNANIAQIEQEFKSIEALVKGLSAEIAVDINVADGKKNINYLLEYCDRYQEKLISLGEKTQVTNSIFVYFNHNLFNNVADCWVYGENPSSLKRQATTAQDYSETFHDWYNIPIDEGKDLWTFPYAIKDGSLMTSYVTPIEKDGQIIGLIGMDLSLKHIGDNLKEIILYDTGYLYIMSANGDVIVHPKIDWLDTDGDGKYDTPPNLLDTGDYQFILDHMSSHDASYINYKRHDGHEVFSAYGHLSNGWIVGSSIPKAEVMDLVRYLIFIFSVG